MRDRYGAGDSIVCVDEKDLHTYEECLKEQKIEYSVNKKTMTIRIRKSNAKRKK